MKIGVDLGGTKIEAIVINESGHSIWRKRVATPKGEYEGTLNTIKSLTLQAKQDVQLKSTHPIGIGTPGALFFDEQLNTQVLRNSNSIVLNGRPFLDDLQRHLGCEVYLANDANCFALAEARSGCGVELTKVPNTVFGVILGTGVGGGIVMQHAVLTGRHHIAGEWGHNMLPASALLCLPESERNRSCYCGRQDCIETYISGPGISTSYALRYKQNKSAKDIVEDLRKGNEQAHSIWESYLDQLAMSLAQVVNILDPDLLVLGGGMSLIPEIYQQLPTKIRPYVFTQHFLTPILPAKLGDSAGVYGAAWLTA